MAYNVQLKTANNFFSPIIQNLPSQVYQIKKFWAPVVGLSAVAISIDTLISSKLKNAPEFANLSLKFRVHLISGVVTTALCYVASGFLSDFVGSEELPIFIGSTFVILSLKFAIIYFKSNKDSYSKEDMRFETKKKEPRNLQTSVHFKSTVSKIDEEHHETVEKTPGGQGGSNSLRELANNPLLPEKHRLIAKGEDEEKIREALNDFIKSLKLKDGTVREKIKAFDLLSQKFDDRDEFGHSVLSLALENQYPHDFIEELISKGFRIWTCDQIRAIENLDLLIDRDQRETIALVLNPKYATTREEKQKLLPLRLAAIEHIIKKFRIKTFFGKFKKLLKIENVVYSWLEIFYRDYRQLLIDFITYCIVVTKRGNNEKKKLITMILALCDVDEEKRKCKEAALPILLDYLVLEYEVKTIADIPRIKSWIFLLYPGQFDPNDCVNDIWDLVLPYVPQQGEAAKPEIRIETLALIDRSATPNVTQSLRQLQRQATPHPKKNMNSDEESKV